MKRTFGELPPNAGGWDENMLQRSVGQGMTGAPRVNLAPASGDKGHLFCPESEKGGFPPRGYGRDGILLGMTFHSVRRGTSCTQSIWGRGTYLVAFSPYACSSCVCGDVPERLKSPRTRQPALGRQAQYRCCFLRRTRTPHSNFPTYALPIRRCRSTIAAQFAKRSSMSGSRRCS